ncbi:MAG TPA: SCO family protein [Myxococcales bacterium]
MSSMLRTMAAALLLGAAALLPAGPAQASTEWGANYFPNVPLTTQDGKVVHFYDDLLKGKAVAINLMYTHCNGSCPLETARMVQVQKLLGDRVGKDLFFYSISIEPERDTPEVMKKYAARYHIDPSTNWLFLTGKMEDIKLISKKLGLSSLTDRANKDGHLPTLMIGNEPTGAWMRNSAVDNPRFLAVTITNFLDGFKKAKPIVNNYADVRPETFHKPEYMFKSRCAACHTIGGGDAVGPDLKGLLTRRDRTWARRYMTEPDKMLAEHDPVAVSLFEKYRQVRMPNLSLSPEDVEALLLLIDTPAGPAHAAGSITASAR